MRASKPTSPSIPRVGGFSLIELLVALVFTAILTTGMLRIFASSVNGFYTQQETLGMQRNSRFVLDQVQEDLLEAGYLFPPRSLRSNFTLNSTTAQPPLLIQQTGYTPVWKDANGTSATLNPVDEIQVVEDMNLDIDGTINTAVAPGATSATVNIPSGATTLAKYIASGTSNLSMIMLDSQSSPVDMLKVQSISGTGPYTVSLSYSAGSAVDQYGNPVDGGFFTGTFNNNHAVNAPCMFIAPLQVVRYTVVPRALNPADPTNLVPCLVRQTAPLDSSKIFVPTSNTAAPAAPDTEEILAEGVTGFKADISLDGGKTWQRYNADGTLKANADTWANFYSVLDTAIQSAVSSTSPLYANLKFGLNNPTDPLWTNYLPVTLRLDIQTSSRVARADYRTTNTGAPAFRTRTVTMLISPRNYAHGSPQ